MRVVHAAGLEGARAATGLVVVIDVLRAFTVSAYALAGGASACRLVGGMPEARRLAAAIPGAVISAEVEGLPVHGVAISNSPTMIREAGLAGRVLVQRTSSGTQAVLAADPAGGMLAGSLVVARATVAAIQAAAPEVVTFVASGADRGHDEDRACADYMEGILRGRPVDLVERLAPLRRSDRWLVFAEGGWPGFPPSDLDLAMAADRFDFAMPVSRDRLGLLVTPLYL